MRSFLLYKFPPLVLSKLCNFMMSWIKLRIAKKEKYRYKYSLFYKSLHTYRKLKGNIYGLNICHI